MFEWLRRRLAWLRWGAFRKARHGNLDVDLGKLDADLNYVPCAVCGRSKNDPEWASRMPCENCGRVICYRCADTGVHGSLPDFRHFVTGPFNRRPYHLSPDSCPYCKTMAWMKKHGE